MTATYTWDVFSSLDGYGAHSGNWGGYWGQARIGRTCRCWPRASRSPS